MKPAYNNIKMNRYRNSSLVKQNLAVQCHRPLLGLNCLSHDPVNQVADQVDMFLLLFILSQHI